MEEQFFNLYAGQSGLSLAAGHNPVADWGIEIYDRKSLDSDDPVVQVSGCDRAKVFAEAYVKLADYLSLTRGGY